MSKIELTSFDDASDFDTEALAEKKVKLVLQTPSGKDMTFSYRNEDGEEVTEVQYFMMLSDQSSRYKNAKSKLMNQVSSSKNKKYVEDDDIQRTSDLVASVVTEVKVVYNKELLHIDNEDGSETLTISKFLSKSVEFREQAVELINNRSEYLGNSKTS